MFFWKIVLVPSLCAWAKKVALALSGLRSKDDFCRAVEEGDPVFPTLVSVKVTRNLKTFHEPGDAPSLAVNMQVLCGCAQYFTLTRTKSVLTLIPIMKSFKGLTSAIMPATVAMLTSSKIYSLCVQYPGMEAQPCNKAWVLLKATTKSILSEEPPYTATNHGVQDALDTEAPHASAKFTLVCLGTKTNLSSLRLAPAYGKPAFALAVVSSLDGNTFYAETAEIIQAGDVQHLATAMKQEMALAAELKRSINQPLAYWSNQCSPMQATHCRVFRRSPTGPDIDPLLQPATKTIRTA